MAEKIKIDMEFLKTRPLSYSSLSHFLRSPAHYYHYITQPKPPPTEALILGGVFDCLLLMPDLFDEKYAMLPAEIATANKNSNLYKDGYRAFCAAEEERYQAEKNANPGKTIYRRQIIDMKVLEQSQAMREAVMRNDDFKTRLEMADNFQTEIYFTDKKTGLPICGKIDIDGFGRHGFIADLKTAADGSPEAMPNQSINYHYFLQAGLYCRSYHIQGKFPEYFILAVEKNEPYACGVYLCSKDFVKLGVQTLERLLTEYKYCMENNLWHESYNFRTTVGYSSLDLPAWAKKQLE